MYDSAIHADALMQLQSQKHDLPIYQQSPLGLSSMFHCTSKEALCLIEAVISIKITVEERRCNMTNNDIA